MECLWSLFSHWQPDGNRYQQDPAVFYLHVPPHDGIAYPYLYGAGFLAEYAEIYLGRET